MSADLARTKSDDGTMFLGDGSMAAAPAPKLHQRGLRSIVKVIDDRCLYVYALPPSPALGASY
ncbi:hypothetical protein IMZ48_15195 [Candidatus Bathyarchaeota archaeon]|nr:hypothetical protein [Candidatus Bathyarchaeota archaeon]